MEICSFLCFLLKDTSDPIQNAAIRFLFYQIIIILVNDFLRCFSVPPDAAAFRERAAGEIDIPDHARPGRLINQLFQHLTQISICHFVNGTCILRQSNSPVSQEGRFESSACCRGILDIRGGIVSIINPGQDDIRRLAHHCLRSNPDTVRRCPAAGKCTYAFHLKRNRPDLQRPVQCNAVGGRTSLIMRRDHPYGTILHCFPRKADDPV